MSAMVERSPSLAELHAEMDRARSEFHSLVAGATPDDLQRKSDGTEWTNRQLLFHMLFGYLITLNLRVIVRLMSRAPDRVQRGFAGLLDATARAVLRIESWGSWCGETFVSPGRADAWLGRVIA